MQWNRSVVRIKINQRRQSGRRRTSWSGLFWFCGKLQDPLLAFCEKCTIIWLIMGCDYKQRKGGASCTDF